jgi:hypothetical protein
MGSFTSLTASSVELEHEIEMFGKRAHPSSYSFCLGSHLINHLWVSQTAQTVLHLRSAVMRVWRSSYQGGAG